MKTINPPKSMDETLDTFYHGRILVLQKKKGYRFSIDAPLLADFVQTKSTDKCLELGTGCGIISLLLSIKPFSHIKAVEIQESLVDLARRNVRLNQLEDRISIVHADLRRFYTDHKFDVMFSNPPYIKAQAGHLSASSEKSIAKHELKCDILDIMHKTAELLKKRGRAYFIFTAKRKQEFVQAVKKSGMAIKVIRFVVPRHGSQPNFFLTECGFLRIVEKVLPPLVLFDKEGNYRPEAQDIFAGRSHAASFQ
jgi:tRNA1Val (adenine37-N6)-methyltransferase